MTINKVSYAVDPINRRVYVEYSDGTKKYFDVSNHQIHFNKTMITLDEINEVKKIAKKDGKWIEYGFEEERKHNQEMHAKVARGEAEYTYDSEGMISGIVTRTDKPDGFLFDTAHGMEG